MNIEHQDWQTQVNVSNISELALRQRMYKYEGPRLWKRLALWGPEGSQRKMA